VRFSQALLTFRLDRDDLVAAPGQPLEQLMVEQNITKKELARRMGTSRSALERLLDPDNPSVTLLTLERAAKALGKRITVELAA